MPAGAGAAGNDNDNDDDDDATDEHCTMKRTGAEISETREEEEFFS